MSSCLVSFSALSPSSSSVMGSFTPSNAATDSLDFDFFVDPDRGCGALFGDASPSVASAAAISAACLGVSCISPKEMRPARISAGPRTTAIDLLGIRLSDSAATASSSDPSPLPYWRVCPRSSAPVSLLGGDSSTTLILSSSLMSSSLACGDSPLYSSPAPVRSSSSSA